MIHQPSHEPESEDRVSEEHERARALADVLRDQAERARAALDAERRRHRRTRLRRGAVSAVWVAAAYVWVFSPGWSRVETPPPPSLAEDVRALRINLFLQTQQVEAFEAARGRLPWVLQEVGPPLPGMEYRRLDNQRYELEARSDRVRMSYSSRVPPLEFVGDAASLLNAGAQAEEAFPEVDVNAVATASRDARGPSGGVPGGGAP